MVFDGGLLEGIEKRRTELKEETDYKFDLYPRLTQILPNPNLMAQ